MGSMRKLLLWFVLPELVFILRKQNEAEKSFLILCDQVQAIQKGMAHWPGCPRELKERMNRTAAAVESDTEARQARCEQIESYLKKFSRE
jgi:hypothetical protein